jgi:lipopolysaccharide export system protein LptA
MKRVLFFLLAASCGVAVAQTNSPAQKAESRVEISSDSGHFDGNTRQMIYIGNVFVTDNAKARLHCGQLTVDLPVDGGHPTNIVAESDVAIDVLDGKGQTNHITSDKATYAYSVVGSVTNETVTFSGGKPMPKVENPQIIIYGEPLVLNVAAKTFGGSNYRTVIKQTPKSSAGTNDTPFNFLR